MNVDDLLEVINNWGACSGDLMPHPCGDGTVGVDDLLEVINNWGDICNTSLNGGGGGSITSVEDCMDMCSLSWDAFTTEWTDCVNKCVEGLCQVEIIECED